MSFYHGVRASEIATAITPPVEQSSLIVAFGTAPMHLAAEPAGANKPVLCYNYAEFVKQFGWSDDFEKYTLCEAAYSQFVLYGMSPMVFVNVLDESKHNQQTEMNLVGVTAGVTLKQPIILDSFKATVTVEDDGEEVEEVLVKGEDYKLTRDDDGNTLLEILKPARVPEDKVKVSFKEVKAESVTASDIIGGADPLTDTNKGLELVEEIYPKFRLVPTILIAPKFSQNVEVAAVMKAKCTGINGVFRAIALVDLPTAEIANYTNAAEYKNQHNLVDENLVVCYPKVSLDGKQFYMSTQLASLMCRTDYYLGDEIPYYSPSNQNMQIDSTVMADGTEKLFSLAQANYLNSQGISTALNFSNGWVFWSNRTGCYPSVTDVKDSFIAVRRFFSWYNNHLILTYFQQVDSPINRRLIDNLINSEQIFLNGLQAKGVILGGGEIEFREGDNPTTDLLNGKIEFHVNITPAIPAEEIHFKLEYDVSGLQSLFN